VADNDIVNVDGDNNDDCLTQNHYSILCLHLNYFIFQNKYILDLRRYKTNNNCNNSEVHKRYFWTFFKQNRI